MDGDTFFDDKLIPVSDKHSYVDVGAYTGDTLLKFYAFSRGRYKKIMQWNLIREILKA